MVVHVGFDYAYLDISQAQEIKILLASHISLTPLLGLEPVAPIRPQFPDDHDNHSTIEIFIKRILNYPMIYMRPRNHAVEP